MTQGIFVTGTDTDVGKTFASVALLREMSARGARVFGLKPVAAGAEQTAQGWRNEDALSLMAASSVALPYEQVNPVCLPAALAPHIAARQAGRRLHCGQLIGWVRGALATPADLALVEGAGGWRTPLSEREMLSRLPQELALPVILVVALRLGCLNHALLTAEAIRHDGVRLLGWIGNVRDLAMPAWAENQATLQALLAAPCLALLGPQGQLLQPWDLTPLHGFAAVLAQNGLGGGMTGG